MRKYILAVVILLYCFITANIVFAVPDQFTFTDQTDVDLNVLITSNTITVSGITAAVPISIKGGTYSINDGTYTSDEGTVYNGDVVTVQLMSSGSYSTTTQTTLTIGNASDSFIVTTTSEPKMVGDSHDGCHCDYDGHCDDDCHCDGEIHCDHDGYCHCDGHCYCDDDDSVYIHCFVASVAFGSPMAGQVKILQQFRDRYLLTNALGRKFVSWYYKNGPIAANWIKDKPLAKVAVQVALYPLIGFSFLMISGYMPLVIIGLLLSVLIYLRFRPKKLGMI